MTGVLIRYTEDGHGTTEAEVEVTQSQVKRCRAGQEESLPTPSSSQRSEAPQTPWFRTWGLQSHEPVRFCGLKTPGLWSFLSAAVGNSCIHS